jgi:CBS-domain-containing membrane protein
MPTLPVREVNLWALPTSNMTKLHPKKPTTRAKKRLSFAALPDIVWAPLTSAALMLIVGLMGLLAHQPWLFPSLGPTAFLLVETPEQPSARFYNVVVGHLLGVGAGFLAIVLCHANDAPAVLSTHHLTAVRVWATVLAVALNMLGGILLKASHPPAAATTLLVALGGFPLNWQTTLTIVMGVLIVAIVGEGLRHIRLKATAKGDRDEL